MRRSTDRPGNAAEGASSIPAAYLRLLLEACAGEDSSGRSRLLEGTALGDPRDDGWPAAVPLSALERVVANAARDRPPGWHLAVVPRLDSAVHGALGFAALSAPSLAVALDVLLTYGRLRLPFLTFASRLAGSRVRLTLASARAAAEGDGPVLEIAALATASFVAQFTARDPRQLTVLLPGSPRPYQARLAEATPATVSTGRSAYGVEWPRHWLGLGSPLSDEGLHRLSVERCREQLARTTGRTPLEEAIRHAVLAAGGRPPGLASLAAARHVAPRTLMRRLGESGTSYQRIVDDVRAELAMDYLRHTRLPLAAIAERLGFSDTSNFSRAFRAWFGRSPGSCRSAPR